jgi:uncharacterized repeat protein (TIGR03847 family)
MTSSFDFDAPDHVTAGAIGPPGQRVFYLQARQEGEVVSLRLEKQQVAALCEYLAGILNDLATVTDAVPTDLDLIEPVVAEWVTGALAVAYEEADDRILLVAEEFVPDLDDEDDDDDDDGDEDGGDPDDDDIIGLRRALGADGTPASTARFRLTRAQVLGMVRHASSIVAAGRPICQICGRPMDPAGHFCPRNN